MALKPYRSTAHWKKIRIQVLNRDGWTCTYCGDVADQVDHVIPKVSGGEDILENLTSACRRCNLAKGRKAVFLARVSTPPASEAPISPKRTHQSKLVQNGHTTVRIDPDSPFVRPADSGATE